MVFMGLITKLMGQMKSKGGDGKAAGFDITPDMMEMVKSFTVLRLSGMLGMVNVTLTKEQLLDLNAQLNKIKKK